MNKFVIHSAIMLVCLMSTGCDKEEKNETDPIVISTTPSIQLVDLSPTSVKQFGDPLKFVISYTDGDGDIGFSDADEPSLEITDLRGDLVHHYHIPPVAPDTAIAIHGTLEVELENIILLDENNNQEIATFSIRLKDRAGNWSLPVTSGEITITK